LIQIRSIDTAGGFGRRRCCFLLGRTYCILAFDRKMSEDQRGQFATSEVRMNTATMPAAKIDDGKMQALLGHVVEDFGASLSASLVWIGQELGLYRALAEGGPMTAAQLAAKTGTHERYIREWLLNQAAGGYIEYESSGGRYRMSPEQAVALTDEQSPFFVGGGFYVIKAMNRASTRILDAFRTGAGMRWGEHDPDLFIGTERFFRPGYAAHLVSEWIPSLEGVDQALRRGGVAADVGCGHGASTIIMATAYPRSRFFGFDNHEASIERARQAAQRAGLEERVAFEVAEASKIPSSGYDLIAYFDCLHDMGDPLAALRRARELLASGGTVMIVEPMAGRRVEENFNPIGRTYSAASALCCTPNAMATGGQALGTVATDDALREVATAAGFTTFRRATETPFNRIFEAKG
jgi:SAM-dependent methyltransferase